VRWICRQRSLPIAAGDLCPSAGEAMTKRIGVLISVVVMLTAAILLISDSPHKGVTLTFQRFADHPANGRMALFVITNQWDCTICFVGDSEVKSDEHWKELKLGDVGTIGLVGDSWESAGTLESGASASVAVKIPEGVRDWRAAVRNSPTSDKLDRLIFHLRANGKALFELKPLPGFKGNFYGNWAMTNYSREFRNDLVRLNLLRQKAHSE